MEQASAVAALRTSCGADVIVDAELLDALNAFAWRVDGEGYVVRRYSEGGRYRSQSLHRQIAGATDRRLFVDHRDRNKLNNLRSNLRIVTPAESARNRGKDPGGTSRFRGVGRSPRCRRWQAYLHQTYLGMFDCEIEAARAFLTAAETAWGREAVAVDAAALEAVASCAGCNCARHGGALPSFG